MVFFHESYSRFAIPQTTIPLYWSSNSQQQATAKSLLCSVKSVECKLKKIHFFTLIKISWYFNLAGDPQILQSNEVNVS